MNPLFAWVHHSAHKNIFRWRPKGKKSNILDLGCGTGDHFQYLKKESRIIGMDSCLPYLKSSREKNKEIWLIQGDIYNMPFKDEAIGDIINVYNLEHLFHLGLALLEIQRILNRKGRFFCGLPTEGGFAWDFSRRIGTARTYKKKFGLDHIQVMKIEHCNNYSDIMKKLELLFNIKRKKYFPFRVPSINLNLTVSLSMTKKKFKQ